MMKRKSKWTANKRETNIRVEDEDGTCVCTVWGVNDSSWRHAREIAAAPDLLEALKDCLEMVRRLKRHMRISDNAGYSADGRMLKLTKVEEASDAAIAKAEGLS